MNYIEVFQKRVPKMYPGGNIWNNTQVTGNAVFSFEDMDKKLASVRQNATSLESVLTNSGQYNPTLSLNTPVQTQFEAASDSRPDITLSTSKPEDPIDGTFIKSMTAAARDKYFQDKAAGKYSDPQKSDLSLLQGIDKMKTGGIYEAVGDVVRGGFDALDNGLMGDKNFDADSKAKDVAADSLAKVASKFGPYGLIAAAAIKGLNTVSKGLGANIRGYDAQLDNSGYGTLGSREQQSTRLMDRVTGKSQALARRQYEQSQLAMRAKTISDDVKFEQEARSNSIDNVIQNNQIALSGGINSSLLAAKKGAKLTKLKQTITRAQYGAKLKKVEISEEKSLLPEGDLHKNKHDDFDLPVTEKGIPVVHLENGAEVQTLEDIQEHKEHVVQDAEIETNEVIFSKELTDYVEEARKKWHDGDDDVLLEVGKRVTKELLHNTMDNTGLIKQLREKDEGLVH